MGGFSTKIHILVDALGNPVEFILTGGQQADVTQAEALMQDHQADAVIADKAYDSDAVVDAAKRQGAEAVIPSKKNRKMPREYDKHLYKDRKKVEWFINLLTVDPGAWTLAGMGMPLGEMVINEQIHKVIGHFDGEGVTPSVIDAITKSKAARWKPMHWGMIGTGLIALVVLAAYLVHRRKLPRREA